MAEYETVIGLEVHVELATKTKIFCGCSTKFGARPNENTCPVCMGMPGTLPVLNKKVVEYAIAVGLALNCDISRYSKFDRKNYFYPDNPQNYQISQLYMPICTNGFVNVTAGEGSKKIRIHEIHMEEDAGKLIHDDEEDVSLIDYNRAGVPLIEIVSEPDMSNAEEVIAYLKKLKTVIGYLGASDCKLQEGSMRADVNLSVRPVGKKELGTRTEMKNLSSFRAISRAIENEKKRQIKLIENGERVIQQTRHWDDKKGESYSMRSKEDAMDYRYFPEPDLMPLIISEKWIDEIKANEPEMAEQKIERYILQFNIPRYDAEQITSEKKFTEIFEETVDLGANPKKVSNWIMGETMRILKEEKDEPENLNISPKHLAKLIEIVDNNTINSSVAKDVFLQVYKNDVDPEVFVRENSLAQVSDAGELEGIILRILSENPKSVGDYMAGKKKAIGFLVGQTMKATKGTADPAMVNKLLTKLLNGYGN